MPTPRRAGREARHPPDAAPPEDLASRDCAADRAHDPVRDADIEYLLKEVSAARAYVDIAEASRDAVLARANLRSALRVLIPWTGIWPIPCTATVARARCGARATN